MTPYPGTALHQAALRVVAAHYERDPRVRAVVLFGSLARGNWHALSDLDLDVVTTDWLDAGEELTSLGQAFSAANDPPLLVIPYDREEGDMVLTSLTQLSIRYHPLEATSPAIVDDFLILGGDLDADTFRAAGAANRRTDTTSPTVWFDEYLAYALEVDTAIRRGRFWLAVELLHRMRGLLMTLFTHAQDGTRPVQTFEAQADPQLQVWLGALLPQYSLESLRQALDAALQFVEQHRAAVTALPLEAHHQSLIERIRDRSEKDEKMGQ